jgi:hypothetical protein
MNLLITGEVRVLNVALAMRVGVSEALFLGQLHYWLKHPKLGTSVEGRKYIHNTFEEWHEQFPFWSLRTLKTVVARCTKEGYVASIKIGKGYDQTRGYAINYDHEALAIVQELHDPVCNDDTTESADIAPSSLNKDHHENTGEISPKAKTVDAIAHEQGLGNPGEVNGFDFQETEVLDVLMAQRDNGSVISVWWRRCLRGYGHVNHVLPELTQKDQKQLKTLLKQLGPTGPLRIMLALKYWDMYKKYANEEFGLKSTVKPVIQKFVLGRNAIAGFEPPKEVDFSEKEWKSL